MGQRLTVDGAALAALGDETRTAGSRLDPPGTAWRQPGDLGSDLVVEAVRTATAFRRETFRVARGALEALADLTESSTTALAAVEDQLAARLDGAP